MMKTLFCVVAWLLFPGLVSAQAVRVGAERMERLLPLTEGKRVSLVVNQTSLCGDVHLLDTLLALGVNVRQVFAPEHGFRGDADAGETVRDGRDMKTGVKIVSLYGKNKKPSPAQLAGTDVVIFDIQDVGARFYTYISTMTYVMESCAECGVSFVVLDRPNPCDYVDGPMRESSLRSFISLLPIPLLHGCTVGELALMINGEGWLAGGVKCDLEVLPVTGWHHGEAWSLRVKPSPNLPNDQSIALYPSLCPFEGTSVSVGRGTTFPFQVLGTPFSKKWSPFSFIPEPLEGFDKNPLHQGVRCYGDDLRQVTPPKGFSLGYVIEYYKAYKAAGVADKFFSRPKTFDTLLGTSQVRMDIIDGLTEDEIRAKWQTGLERYRSVREKYVIYK